MGAAASILLNCINRLKGDDSDEDININNSCNCDCHKEYYLDDTDEDPLLFNIKS